PAGFAAVAFFVVDVIPDMVLRPYVSARELHMGTVMFAYILGPLLFGWYGIFLGPMLLVIAVRFNRIVLPELLARFFDSPPDPPVPGPPVAAEGDVPAGSGDSTAPPTDEAASAPPTDEAARGEDPGDSPGSDPTAGDD
ncbi:MAG: AI-2E family transporter, partial [Halobacteriales archaeon]